MVLYKGFQIDIHIIKLQYILSEITLVFMQVNEDLVQFYLVYILSFTAVQKIQKNISNIHIYMKIMKKTLTSRNMLIHDAVLIEVIKLVQQESLDIHLPREYIHEVRIQIR